MFILCVPFYSFGNCAGVTLAIEEGQKIVYVRCLVGEEETLSVVQQ
jgi:hypothetical protein